MSSQYTSCPRCGSVHDPDGECYQLYDPLLHLPASRPGTQQRVMSAPTHGIQKKISRRMALLGLAGGTIALSTIGLISYKLIDLHILTYINPHILTYSGHTRTALTAVWSPDGTRVASMGMKSTVLVWEPFTGTTLQTCTVEEESVEDLHSQRLVWSRDGKQLLALVRLKEVVQLQVWDVATGRRVRSFPVMQLEKRQTAGPLPCVWTLNEQYLAVAKLNETDEKKQVIEIWDVGTEQMLATFSREDRHGWIPQLVWLPNHRQLAIFGSDDAGESTVGQIWEVARGESIRLLTLKDEQLPPPLVWFPDGKSLTSGLAVYNGETGRTMTTFYQKLIGWPVSVACSPDGKRLAVSSVVHSRYWPFFGSLLAVRSDTYTRNLLCIVNASDGWLLARHDEDQEEVRGVAWSPDGRSLLVVKSDVEVWNFR